MKILITGGSGFIGSHIVDELLRLGHEVRILDRKSPFQKSGIDFVKGDFMKDSIIKKAIKGIDVIYHIGGFSNIDMVKDNPLKTIEFNILGTAKLLEAARKNKTKRFVFASSIYVNDNKGHLYTTSKIASEMLCRDYFTLYGLPYTILRFGTVYGPRSRMADVISRFVDSGVKDKTIKIYGDGNQKRNFIYVKDAAEASAKTLSKKAINKTYLVADKSQTSINELAQIVAKKIGKKVKILKIKSLKREDDYSGNAVGSPSLNVFKALKIKQKYNLKKGVEEFINWYLKNN